MNIILFSPEELSGLSVRLPRRDPRAAHLIKTLHKKPGDQFEAGVLGGRRGRGRVCGVSAAGELELSLSLDEDAPKRLPVTVGVGFCRPIEMRRLFRDLSSMGAAEIAVFGSDNGEKSYRDTKLFEDGGARSALIEGAVQSRDTTLPRLSTYVTLARWLAALGAARPGECRFACDNVRPRGAFGPCPSGSAPGALTLAIGSERGWTDGERQRLEEAGFTRLALGSRALRTETACVAAFSFASAWLSARP